MSAIETLSDAAPDVLSEALPDAGSEALLNMVHSLAPISLDALNSGAELMTRFDSKFFVPRSVLAELLAAQAGRSRVLEIDGRRSMLYRTVYFDTPEFRFYRDHVQRRRHRFKVRTRSYCDSGGCMLEVKSKGYRGATVKQRVAHDPSSTEFLDRSARAFVEEITGGGSDALRPVLETLYRRTTVALGDQRITIDLGLECTSGRERRFGPHHALVETKSPGRSSPFELALRERGIRPHSVSKYCVGAALLYPQLPSNPWHRTMDRYFTA